MAKRKINDEQLVSLIKAHRAQSLGDLNADLTNERATALDHYHGRPYGDEQDGRSQVVSRDLSETVDWVMPSLMRLFVQSGALAEFTPVGPEDEQAAQQESDYVNHVIMEENDGFLVLYDWIKDTLLLKNGYVKHYWEENNKITESRYEGLTLDETTVLLQSFGDALVEIVGQEERIIQIDQGGVPVPLAVFDIHLKVTRKEARVCIEAVPTEEVRVSKRCRGSLQVSPFTEHVTRKTRSELIEMGMEREFVENAPAYNENDHSGQTIARDSVTDESLTLDGMVVDHSTEEVLFCEAYLLVDYDGDGIAELRKVVTVGDKIPPGDKWNETMDTVPMTGMVCKRVPHRHVGESLDDELADLQRIKTVLSRQLLDNIYLTNNQELLINERAHLPDFMVSLPGGVKRIKGEGPVQDSAMPLIRQPIIDQILPALDYVDQIKSNRTGIDRTSTGLDPDTLRQSTKGAFIENLNRASQKVEMIARMLAETGVKELVRHVHGLTLKHQDKAKMVKLRGKYVSVNPQEWKERTNLKVKVGIGTGSGEEKRQNIGLISMAQERLAALGLVGDQEAYNLFTDLVQSIGIDLPEKYAINPDPQNAKYNDVLKKRSMPQPNPLVEVEQAKGQMVMQREQMTAQANQILEYQRIQHEQAMRAMESRMEAINAEAERRSREAIAVMQAEVKAMIEGMKIDVGQKGVGAEIGTQG